MPSVRWAEHRRCHFCPNSVALSTSGMKFGAKVLTRLAVFVPTIHSVGTCMIPRSTPLSTCSGVTSSSRTGRLGESPAATQARYSFCPIFCASL